MSDPRWQKPREPRPWPVAPLARTLAIPVGSTAKLAVRLGRDRRTIMRYRQWGLSTRQADEWCTAVDLNPAEVWPAWTAYGLRGVGLLNAAREVCPHCGAPYDVVDSEGKRRCSARRREQVAQAVRNLRYRRSREWITPVSSAQEVAS